MKNKEKKKKIISNILVFIIALLFIASFYIKKNLALVNFEEIVYYLNSGLSNSDNSSIFIAIKECLPYLIVLFLLLYIIFNGIKIKDKLYSIKYFTNYKKIYIVILLVLSLGLLLNNLNLFEYLININTNSEFIENNYIDPKDTNITFNKKNNLIFIVVESLESSFFTKEQGGYWNYEIIPELYNLTKDKDSISNSNSITMKMLRGASFTTGSVVTNTTGIPLKSNLGGKGFTSSSYMPGSYALGDLLKDNGYYNELISASNTTFGGLKDYYKNHGNFEIIDIDTLNKYNLKMTSDDKGRWGFNDKYLFEIAKKRLDIISKKEEPFDLQLITIDTHFFDGFIGNYSETKHNLQYENAYATTSKLINDFVNWLKEQPYYKDTTIVIVGDHLTMQSNFINDSEYKDRSVYNCIINPVNNMKINKDRKVTALDTYPTIVASIGGIIKGNKLGLGINIFSEEKTLIEEYGLKKLDNELKKNSKYYKNKILKEDR